MIRCVRLWTGDDDASHVEEGALDFVPGPHGDFATGALGATHVSFEETATGGSLVRHTAPVRQLVLTLSGTLDFRTRDGETFQLTEGEVLLAEDTAGTGHEWSLVGETPWRRAYVVLGTDVAVPFSASIR